ncbi:MAG: DUF4097 domain-containing protein [Chloroflexi bacterium]|jgi:hypothetical protein|nr:DUF4097 domain-containing protein [Chloroflexota bacterium]
MHLLRLVDGRLAGVPVRGLAVLAALVLLAGCGSSPLEARSTETRQLALGGVTETLVVIETFNGPVTVRAGEPGRVEATLEVTGTGTTRAEADADRANVATTLEEEVGRVRLRAVYAPNPGSPGNRGAAATVMVPPGSELEIRTSNGAVTVDGVGAALRVVTSNAAVTVAGSTGDTVVETSNGDVRLTAAGGMIDVRSSNAPVTVEATDAIVAVATSSGAVRFEGSLAPGDSSFVSSNGPVEVALPAEATFAIDASTSNGRVIVDFALVSSGAASSTEVQGSVGSDPVVAIAIETSNADVTVRPAR